jgi:hypothetical protein
MATVTITRTTALFPRAVFVQWDIDPDRGDGGTFIVNVYRAGSPGGPWELIGASLRDAYHFLDKNFNLPPSPKSTDAHEGVNLFSLSRDIYYQVVVTPPSGVQFISAPTPVEPGLDARTRLFKRKILRDESIAFRRLNGIAIIVLKRRHWGTRCRACWDPVTNEGTREHCRTCYGTTFEGGYWAPVLIRGRRTPGAVETQIAAHGETEVKAVNFIVLDYPHLEYKDILVDLRRNDRFRIERVTPTELKTVAVHQTCACSELGRNSVEYDVPVDPDTTPSLY